MKKNILFNFTLFLGLIFLIGCRDIQKKGHQDEQENWVQLFNGKDLQNWTVKIKGHPVNDNDKNTFRVTNGVLQVNYDEYDSFGASFGHIFYNQEFSNYKLRLQYRFTGNQLKDGPEWATRNSGLMLHCQDPKTMELDQFFPVSVEVQLLGGLNTGDRPTGNVCTPGTHIEMDGKLIATHCLKSNSNTFNGDQWVQLEVEVMNDSIISHKINGEIVISYSKPIIGGKVENVSDEVWKSREGKALKKGFISLQSESHPVEFRNIEILEL